MDSTLPPAEELYVEFEGLIKWHAKQLCGKCGVEWDDAVQHMALAFMTAYRNFKAGKQAKFNTFLTCCLQNAIKDVLAKWYNDQRVSSDLSLDEQVDWNEAEEEGKWILPSPDIRDVTETILYHELQSTLSPVARAVMECYIEPGKELVAQILGEGKTKIQQRHVSEFLHITLDKVQNCRNEIRDRVKELGFEV
jgi:RNA polymerase sigma factor (sigma-70 family)